MEIYRISRKEFGETLSGVGASRFGGRWNSKGNEVIYCSGNRPLALIECLVNDIPMSLILKDYLCIVIHIPDSIKIEEITNKHLFKGWDYPERNSKTATLGDKWITSLSSVILKVPSASVTGEYNFLINPLHSDFKKLKPKIEIFPFDTRLTNI